MHICNWAPPDGIRMALPRLDWSTYTYRMHIMHDMRACMQHAAAMLATESPAAACAQCMGKNKGTCIYDPAMRCIAGWYFVLAQKIGAQKQLSQARTLTFERIATGNIAVEMAVRADFLLHGSYRPPPDSKEFLRRSSRGRGSTTLSCSRRPAPIGKWKAAIGVWRRQAAHRPQLARSANVDA